MRDRLIGFHGCPGTDGFTVMVRKGSWKYIFIANGGREQLFNLEDDPLEHVNRISGESGVAGKMRALAAAGCQRPGADAALEDGRLRAFPYRQWERKRIHQFDRSRGVQGFPEHPGDVLSQWEPSGPGGPYLRRSTT